MRSRLTSFAAFRNKWESLKCLEKGIGSNVFNLSSVEVSDSLISPLNHDKARTLVKSILISSVASEKICVGRTEGVWECEPFVPGEERCPCSFLVKVAAGEVKFRLRSVGGNTGNSLKGLGYCLPPNKKKEEGGWDWGGDGVRLWWRPECVRGSTGRGGRARERDEGKVNEDSWAMNVDSGVNAEWDREEKIYISTQQDEMGVSEEVEVSP